jgi:hypothetical protein
MDVKKSTVIEDEKSIQYDLHFKMWNQRNFDTKV